MIALSHDPTRPEERDPRIYFPLCYKPDSGLWVAIPDALNGCAHEIEAAQVCAEHLRGRWQELRLQARTLSALCEHPELADFEADGIDGATLRHSARRLTTIIYHVGIDVADLLEHADTEHRIQLDTTRYGVNSATGLIEPLPEPLL